MNITVIGSGYVGLVSGAVFANWGHDVLCLDIDKSKVEKINNGIMPIYEEGLEDLVKKIVKDKKFKAVTDYNLAVKTADIIFICVGTPSNQDGAADLKYVYSAAKSIAENLDATKYRVVVTKSTVPVGTNDKVLEIIKNNLLDKNINIDVASNPEFLREGTSIYDANNPDRIVLGSNSIEALKLVSSLYAHLNVPIVKTNVRSAELIKYAANAFLATKISFINEISQICEKTGADVMDVARGMGLDKRIGEKFLNASIGYGGSCFPKDVEALYRTSSENMYDFRLLRGVMDANDRQKLYFLAKIFNRFGQNLTGLRFGVLGAAFKAGTDDTRKSVAIDVIRILRGSGAHIILFDPEAIENAKRDLGHEGITYVSDNKELFNKTDAVIILTEWPVFKTYDYVRLSNEMHSKIIFDGRNILEKLTIQTNNIEYYSIGRV